MPYLIDGHNLIGALPNISLAEPDDEASLIALLQSYCLRTRKQAVVYFDRRAPAAENPPRGSQLTVIFVQRPRTADQAILSHLKRLGKEARNWTVISSDREVQQAAKHFRADVITSQEFSRLLGESGNSEGEAEKPTPNLSADELNDWLRLFQTQKD